MAQVPTGYHITYQQQFRKCGKPSCKTCREGKGHGPYWYAYWREDGKLKSTYVGKQLPTGAQPGQLTQQKAGRKEECSC